MSYPGDPTLRYAPSGYLVLPVGAEFIIPPDLQDVQVIRGCARRTEEDLVRRASAQQPIYADRLFDAVKRGDISRQVLRQLLFNESVEESAASIAQVDAERLSESYEIAAAGMFDG